MNKRMLFMVVFIALLSIAAAGCIPGDGAATSAKPAGFLWGIWHGWIAPISLIAKLFNGSLRIYEPVNTGFWYDLGFYMAVVGGFGGVSLARRKRSDRRRD